MLSRPATGMTCIAVTRGVAAGMALLMRLLDELSNVSPGASKWTELALFDHILRGDGFKIKPSYDLIDSINASIL